MAVEGRYYDGRSARSEPLRVEIDAGGLLRPEPPLFDPVPVAQLRLSSRIGNMPATIRLPSGATIETADHETLDRWRRQFGLGRNLAHALERRLSLAVAALVLVALIVVAGAAWGIPWVSKLVADVLPERIIAQLGEGTLQALDKTVLGSSRLGPERQSELAAILHSLLPDSPTGLYYRLLHRDGYWLGANAFALPDGTIIVTDQLVELADDDHEIAAVLLHEIGHVVHRHGVRQVISHAGLAAMTAAILGDISAAGTLALALPNVLMESSYSRAMEWEADSYALERMDQLGIPRASLGGILDRMSAEATDDEAQSAAWGMYFSSHPPTSDRIERFRAPD